MKLNLNIIGYGKFNYQECCTMKWYISGNGTGMGRHRGGWSKDLQITYDWKQGTFRGIGWRPAAGQVGRKGTTRRQDLWTIWRGGGAGSCRSWIGGSEMATLRITLCSCKGRPWMSSGRSTRRRLGTVVEY